MSTYNLFDKQTNSKIEVDAQHVSGNQYVAICPFHDDHNPSLGIDAGRGIYNCLGCGRSGRLCDPQEGSEPNEPDDSGEPDPLRKPIATYEYRDAGGALLYQKLKYRTSNPPPHDKKFYYRRFDENGKEIWGAKGIQRVPYHLPELLRTPGHVFICEGEKDTEALEKLGFTVTTGGGATDWRKHFSSCFMGRDVTILIHNDAAGAAYAETVGRNLYGVAKSVRAALLPGLPEHGDVYDFLNLPERKQISKEQFLELVNELAKPWVDKGAKTLTLVKGCNIHYPPREPIVKGFPLYKKFVYLISGDQGDFKSILTLHTCRCVVSAQYNLFGKYKVVERGPAIMFDEETPQSIMEERLQGFGLKDPDLPFYLCHFSGLQVDDDQWIEEVLRKVDEVHPVFVGFDSFIDFHTKDENSPMQMQQVMKRIRKIANTGPAVWLIAHNSKEAKLTRGTTAIPAAVDMEFFTKVNTKKEVTLEVRKNRVEPFEPIVVVPKFEPTSIRVDYKQTKDQDTWDKIEGLLSDEPISVAGIMEGLAKANVHVEDKIVRNILFNQVSAGLVKTDKIKINITLADGRVQRRSVEHFWK